LFSAQAEAYTRVSPCRIVTLPSAVLPIFPVSNVSIFPPTITSIFSSWKNAPVGPPEVEEERVCAAKRGEAVWVGWVGGGREGGRERGKQSWSG